MKLQGLTGTAKWVKAHQDDDCDLGDLSSPAKLNCIINYEAWSFLIQHHTEYTPAQQQIIFPANKSHLI
eukprot:2467888-Ditylum_brightwellii.AAC.1